MSNELQINERNAYILAQEINVIKDQTGKILLQSSIEIGKRLKEAKELVGHGNWGAWLETSVNYSQKTAQNLIKIYEEYGEKYLTESENPNTKSISFLGYTQALAMLKLDSDERENFLEENDVTTMTTKDLEAAIAEKKAIEEQKNKLLIAVDKLYDENEDLKKQIVETADLQKKLDELKKNKIDPKEITKLEKMLSDKNLEVEKLKRNLADAKAATTVVEVTKEVTPKEVIEEMDKMRTKLSMSEHTVKFKATLKVVETLFNQLVETLEQIKTNDEAVYEQYRAFTNKLLEQLKQ